MRKNRGFTLVELIIVVAIIGVIGAIIFGSIFRSGSSSGDEAEVEARKYAKSLGMDIKGVSCTDRDTDHDGYVSCSVSYLDNGKTEIMPVECAVRWAMNSGCKSPKQVIRRTMF